MPAPTRILSGPTLPAIILFFVIVAAIFLAGTLFAYPLYGLASPFLDAGLDKAVHYGIQLTALAIGIIYLRQAGLLQTLAGTGLGRRQASRSLLAGFAAGIVILLLLELSLGLLGMRQADPDLGAGFTSLLLAIVKAVFTGLLVAVIEEFLYRGAIYTGLVRYSSVFTALLVSSLFYGAVHFIDFQPLPEGMTAGWGTAFHILANAFAGFTDPLILDSLLSLVLLGLLLGLVRWRTGSLVACIGLHAGIVAVNKVASYATDYRPGSDFAMLVNTYDHQTGVVASAWLLLACALYYKLQVRDRQ